MTDKGVFECGKLRWFWPLYCWPVAQRLRILAMMDLGVAYLKRLGAMVMGAGRLILDLTLILVSLAVATLALVPLAVGQPLESLGKALLTLAGAIVQNRAAEVRDRARAEAIPVTKKQSETRAKSPSYSTAGAAEVKAARTVA